MSTPHTADLATRARYRQEGADYEQERIIKLLEGLDCEKNGNPNHDTHDCLYYMTADSLIALIKGEQAGHLGEAIRATAWAYIEGEQPNPLIKGESKSVARRVEIQKEENR